MITKESNTTQSYVTIKLGIDAHAKWYYVARQLDGATPQPVQKMDLDGLLHFVAKQQRLANPLFPALRSRPTAGSGPHPKSNFLAAHLPGAPREDHR